ncbi:linamarin synthase 1-like [Cryptomeria japonica]|uniref:linamarin synthase 1-like n=1 Tax=Cryptomeria japonica TaxID=3369 RepID=UPI0027DA2D47|nr:linamarin synthase 1-like [Cryptomeria japonica]
MISVPFEFPPMDTLEGVENGIEALAKDTGPSVIDNVIQEINAREEENKITCIFADVWMCFGLQLVATLHNLPLAAFHTALVSLFAIRYFSAHLVSLGILHSDEIEAPVDETLSKDVGVYPIGPLIPPEYFHSRTVTKFLASFWKNDTECLQWLDKQCAHSVIYISFQSLAVVSEKQLEELALGVEATQRPFLWIVRSDLVKGSKAILPAGFLERESITMGVSMLCWPYHADQFVNRTYVVDVWKLCLPLHANSQRIIEQGEFVKGVEILLESEQGVEIREEARKLKIIARNAIKDGGSSWNNFNLFVTAMK